MKNLIRDRLLLWPSLLVWLTPLALGACAARSGSPLVENGKVTPQMRAGSPELRTYKIQDWVAPDDRTLIVNTADRSLYEARFKGRCNGVRLADTIAFISQESSSFDKYAGVVLPDGKRCAFASITRLVTTPTPANP